jgi:chaperone modulatory protein CbpM
MKTEEMIPVHDFCVYHNVEQSFIYSLKDSGLIEFSFVEETVYIPLSQLPVLEKLVRLYEMDINLEGIETITYLLQRMNDMQQQIMQLSNRLGLYEHK